MAIRTTLPVLMILMATSGAVAGEPIAKARIHSPWQAAWEAHARSERARLRAIDRQRQANDLMSWYGTYASGSYRSSPSYLRGRGQRRYERRLSRSPHTVPFPGSPGHAFPGGGEVVPVLPYLSQNVPPVENPVGHRKTWTGPNSYVYEPIYASDPASREERKRRADVHSELLAPGEVSAPIPRPAAPAPVPSETIPTPPALPEAIPTPSPE